MLVQYAGEKGTWLYLFCFFGVVGLSEEQNLFRKKQCGNLLLLWGGLCGKESIGADLHLRRASREVRWLLWQRHRCCSWDCTSQGAQGHFHSSPGLPPSRCMNSLLVKGARLTFKTWEKKALFLIIFSFFVLMKYNGTFKSDFYNILHIHRPQSDLEKTLSSDYNDLIFHILLFLSST